MGNNAPVEAFQPKDVMFLEGEEVEEVLAFKDSANRETLTKQSRMLNDFETDTNPDAPR